LPDAPLRRGPETDRADKVVELSWFCPVLEFVGESLALTANAREELSPNARFEIPDS
jgi:hypothetical protein